MTMAITPEQRILGGKRSGVVRRAKSDELIKLRALVIALSTPPDKPAPHPPLEVPKTEETRQTELTRTRERLDTLDRLMREAKDDRQWDNLSRAYERVFRAWAHLAGIPGPGSLRPTAAAARRSSSTGYSLTLPASKPGEGSTPAGNGSGPIGTAP